VVRLEDGPDPCQLDKVVAPADRAEALDVTGGNVTVHNRQGRIAGIQRTVEVGEPLGKPGGYRALEPDGENGDAATDIGTHKERIQHTRRHGGADGGALAGVQVRHGRDVDHAVEGGHLVALRHSIGLDPACGRGEHGDGGLRQVLLPGMLVRQDALFTEKV
jgi:hypothetical protein